MLRLSLDGNIETIDENGLTNAQVSLANDVGFDGLKDALEARAIVLNFPKYRDGRAYTQAVTLRRDLGFTGDIIASGEVLVDQIHLMVAAGFNQFLAPDEARANALAAKLKTRTFAHWRGRPHTIITALADA